MAKIMKNSNVEWIGEIPETWRVDTIGNLFYNRNEKVSDYEFEPLSVTKNGVFKQLDNVAKSNNHNDRKRVCPGDFVINSRSDRKMSSGVSDIEGSVSLINIVLYGNDLLPEYTNYLLKNHGFAEEFYRWGTGIVADLWSTNFERMKRIKVPYPPQKEQLEIASFLDRKVAQINSISDTTKQSITELKNYKKTLITEIITKGINQNVKTKESHIEWIGDVSINFSIVKIKVVTTKIGSGKTPKGGAETYLDEGILFLRSQNIYDTGLHLEEATFISQETDADMKNTRVYPNDVLLNITGGSIGRSCIYPSSMENTANVNQHVCIIRTISEKLKPEFLYYFLNSNAGQSAINYYQTGANREGLNFEQIGNMKIPLPNVKEQQIIIEYLSEKCAHIDNIINQKKQLIIELENYKKSLIYEYITGKREVK